MKRSTPPCSFEGMRTASAFQGVKYVSLHRPRPVFLWFMPSIMDNISNLVRIDVDPVAACRIFISSDTCLFFLFFFLWGGVIKWLICHFTSRLLLATIQAWEAETLSAACRVCLCAFIWTKCLIYFSVDVCIWKITFEVKAAFSIFFPLSLSPSYFSSFSSTFLCCRFNSWIQRIISFFNNVLVLACQTWADLFKRHCRLCG